jgi:hypothetical protein
LIICDDFVKNGLGPPFQKFAKIVRQSSEELIDHEIFLLIADCCVALDRAQLERNVDQLAEVVEFVPGQKPILIFIGHLVQLVVDVFAIGDRSAMVVGGDVLVVYH